MREMALLVGSERTQRIRLRGALVEAGFRVVEAHDGTEGFDRFQREAPDLVVCDLDMAGCDGIALVSRIRAASSVPAILYAAGAAVHEAVAAVKSGADDFVDAAEVDVDEFAASLAERWGRARARRGAPRSTTSSITGASTSPFAGGLLEDLPGRHPAIRRARQRVEALAPLIEPVLVTGEVGSGRRSAARAIHRLGRPDTPMLFLDAGGLTAWPKPPRRGSVYVDGVERLSEGIQESWVREIASPRYDVRWLASGTPAAVAADGPLIPELAERLRRFHVPLPTLRERPDDVPRIARQMVEAIGRRLGRPRRLSSGALRRLRRHPWSGNVAELETVIEKLVAFSPETEIDGSDVESVLDEVGFSVEGLRRRRDRDERCRLLAVLEATGGNVSQAAIRLGRSRAAVYRMVQRHGVPLRNHPDA